MWHRVVLRSASQANSAHAPLSKTFATFAPCRSKINREKLFGANKALRFLTTSSGKEPSNPNNRIASAVAICAVAAVGAAIYTGHKRGRQIQSFTTKQASILQPDPESTLTVLPVSSTDQIGFYASFDTEYIDADSLPIEEAILTTAPAVPPPITRKHPVLLKVPMETVTAITQVTNMYKYEEWTFNGTTPGPFIRARVGDVVELALTNHDTTGNPHNIDSHAFTGPGGGAAITTAEENETKTGRFKLLCPGLYLYHCAAAPVPVHIANGMFGLMYVEPAEGLPPVDKEYYVMQNEIYHEPPEVDEHGRRLNVVEFSYPNGLREEPNSVVFNGSESALTRDNPLKAEVGETVRIFFGNAGPNLTSAFHIIGTHFLNVYRDGDVLNPPGRNIGTVSVPPGGASIVDLKMAVPGSYTIVDHAIFRLDKGAVGFLNVSGKARPDIYMGTQPPEPCVGCKLHA